MPTNQENANQIEQLLREGEVLVASWSIYGEHTLADVGGPDALDDFHRDAETWRLTCLSLLSQIFGDDHPLPKAMSKSIKQYGTARINLAEFIPPLRAALRAVRDRTDGLTGRRAELADLKGKVDFAIITIKEEEFAAVLARFPVDAAVHGRRVYNLSTVITATGEAYAVAVIRCIEQGNGEAQAAARDLIEELEPQWILVVGIAGGVPSTEFTLGDVVVSTRIFDLSVEAVLHDSSREFALGGGPLSQAAAAVVANLPAMRLGSWSDASSIGRAKPTVSKAPANFYGDPEWQRRVRGSLKSIKRDPIVVAGALASSDRLIKDEEPLRLWLKVARQLFAVEMESAGVYRAARSRIPEVPTLAIRGISDIVGFKRDPGWTNYACHSAAAFALAFLRARPIVPLERPARAPVTAHSEPSPVGLVALGPRVTVPGRRVGADGSTWHLELSPPFVLGDEASLTTFCDTFELLDREDRFVALEDEGEGRLLAHPPRWDRRAGKLRLEVAVAAPLPRTDATSIGQDLAMDMDEVPMDLKLNEYVSGVEMVPQCITRVLSINKGGWGAACEIGSRVAELHERLGRSRVVSLIRLELIRLATTPVWDSLDKTDHVVFGFIERVLGAELLPDPADGWLRAQLRLQLHGVKEPWEGFVNICLRTYHLGPKPDFFKGMLEP